MLDQLKNKSLVVIKEGEIIFESDKDRLRPIVTCIKMFKKEMNRAVVIDKIVGLAAAKLFVFAGVKEIHAKIASKTAIGYLNRKIKFSSEKIVESIMNDDKTEVCPMERMAKKLSGEELFEKLNK